MRDNPPEDSPLGHLNLELRTDVWDKEHHPWECREIRNEGAGRRAQKYYHLRTKERKKHEKENVGSKRGREVPGVMEAKERECQEGKNSKM